MSRPSWVHWAKNIFRKNHLQTCSKHVWTLLGKFLDIFEISKIFRFFEFFRSLDPPGCTGQKKSPPDMFKTCLDIFGIAFGLFWKFENFSIFFNLDPPWHSRRKLILYFEFFDFLPLFFRLPFPALNSVS